VWDALSGRWNLGEVDEKMFGIGEGTKGKQAAMG